MRQSRPVRLWPDAPRRLANPPAEPTLLSLFRVEPPPAEGRLTDAKRQATATGYTFSSARASATPAAGRPYSLAVTRARAVS